MGECTCHINPPCGYCLEKVECCICGGLVHPDEALYIQKSADDESGPICDECAENYQSEDVIR